MCCWTQRTLTLNRVRLLNGTRLRQVFAEDLVADRCLKPHTTNHFKTSAPRIFHPPDAPHSPPLLGMESLPRLLCGRRVIVKHKRQSPMTHLSSVTCVCSSGPFAPF